MTDDLEKRLRSSLRAMPLPAAPDALHVRIGDLAASQRRPRAVPGLGLAWSLASLGAALLIVVGAIALSPRTPAASPSPSASPAQTAAAIPATVLARISLPHIEKATVAGDYLWVITDVDPAARLFRIDLRTHAVTVAADPVDFDLQKGDDGSLWVSVATVVGSQITSSSLAKVDLTSGAPRPVSLPPVPATTRVLGTAFGLGSLWLSIESAGLPIDPSLAALWRVDPATGQVLSRRSIDMASITVACGQVWGEPLTESGQLLRQLDPSSGQVTDHVGPGAVYQLADGCWRTVGDSMERLWPEPAGPTVEAPSDLVFDGQAFWRWSGTGLQRWDVATASPIGSPLVLDLADARPSTGNGVGPAPTVVAGTGSVWLVTQSNLVELAVPAILTAAPSPRSEVTPIAVACQLSGSSPAPIFSFAPGAVTSATAEQTAVALFRTCHGSSSIRDLTSSSRPSTGRTNGPNAGQTVWLVQVDATITEPSPGASYGSHFLIEVNMASGVPTIVGQG